MKKVKFKQFPYMITETSFPYPMCQEQIIDCNIVNEAYTLFVNNKLEDGETHNPSKDAQEFIKIFYAAELAAIVGKTNHKI